VKHKILVVEELATRDTAHELIAWEQRRSVLLDWAENGNGRLSVNPDALFGLKDVEKPEGQNTTYFFLEIVRSRESEYERQQSYFMRKMEAFVRISPPGKTHGALRDQQLPSRHRDAYEAACAESLSKASKSGARL
jgi:hypothetical protein